MAAPASLRFLSLMALVEGSSLVALVAIAVPLKYLQGISAAVSIVGPIHGALFLLATATLLLVVGRGHLSGLKGGAVFLASLIPFAGLWSHAMLARTVESLDNNDQ